MTAIAPYQKTILSEEDQEFLQKEIISEWKKAYDHSPIFSPEIGALSEKTRSFLLSFDRVHFYDQIAKKYSFSQEQRIQLPHIIWETALNDDWNNLSQNLSVGISAPKDICEYIAQSLLRDIQNFSPTKIVSQILQRPQTNNQNAILFISLKKAIEKYPRIMSQRITDSDIVFRGSDGAVTPNIKNWITTYHQEMGSGAHEPFERSQFLFHNKNAVMLSQKDRNILSKILESLDEGNDLPIDTDAQKISLLRLEVISDQSSSISNRREVMPNQIRPSSSLASNSNSSIKGSALPKEDLDSPFPFPDKNIRTLGPLYKTKSFSPSKDQGFTPPIQSREFLNSPSNITKNASSLTNKLFLSQQSQPKKLPEKVENTPSLSPQKNLSSPQVPQKGGALHHSAPAKLPPPQKTASTPPSLKETVVNPKTREASASSNQNRSLDYTDYYPIPNTHQRPNQNISNTISFSSSHTFPIEKMSLPRKNEENKISPAPPKPKDPIPTQFIQQQSPSPPKNPAIKNNVPMTKTETIPQSNKSPQKRILIG